MSDHPRDQRLDAWIDGRLDAAERGELERHLAACEPCRRLRDALLASRTALREAVADEPPPPGLAERIRARLDLEDERPAGIADRRRGNRPLLVVALAAGLVAAVLGVAAWWRHGARPVADPVSAAAASYAGVHDAPLPLAVRAREARQVEARWRRGGIAFPARVLDLGGMGIELAGGDATRLGSHLAARSIYLGGGKVFACWMFAGRVSELPPAEERRRHGDFEFAIYRRATTTLVFWQEGTSSAASPGKATRKR